ncbi:MAG: alpha/beta fold hydrolase [Planctomycetaceae bacterium]
MPSDQEPVSSLPNSTTDAVPPASASLSESIAWALPGVPEFRPARGLRNAHLQTLYATLRPQRPVIMGTIQRKLRFSDGDFCVLHDDKPDEWRRGDHVALLMHGLAGCHSSGYMVRTTARLLARNVRVFRLDHRGCGAGRMLASNPYHAGRIQDLEAAIHLLERLCPDSPISVAGFSLSANLLLRYLGDDPPNLPLSLYRAVAVCPPIDLQHCVERLGDTRTGQRYDWYFARQLVTQIANTPQWKDDMPLARTRRPPQRLFDFDELYTAPASGFRSAEHYYQTASARDFISDIRVHTSVLVSADDPLVSPLPWKDVRLPTNITLCVTRHGGHLGFIGRRGIDPDNRWMDWRVVDWLLN